MEPIRPTFASWQASRGIVPWTVRHGIRTIWEQLADFIRSTVDKISEAIAPMFRQIQVAVVSAGQALAEFAKVFNLPKADWTRILIRPASANRRKMPPIGTYPMGVYRTRSAA